MERPQIPTEVEIMMAEEKRKEQVKNSNESEPIKGSTKLWLIVALFGIVALVQFWIIPNWDSKDVRLMILGCCCFYLIFSGINYLIDDNTSEHSLFSKYSIWSLLVFCFKQINKVGDKYLK